MSAVSDYYDALIVGAGPAGSSAAYHLAGRGRRVLLIERSKFPRDKSCGDGVTRAGVRFLEEMGLGDVIGTFQPIRGVEVRMRNRGSRTFEYPATIPSPQGGVVVPRRVLDELLARQAITAGATLWELVRARDLLWDDGHVAGIIAEGEGVTKEIRTPIVVAADGAASVLGRKAGLTTTPADQLGTAIRAYFTNITGLDDLLEIDMPLLDITERQLLPSYGWIFPTGPTSANVGVGVFERVSGVNTRELMDRYVTSQRESDPRFAEAAEAEGRRGAPLRFDFSPERTARPGIALVGDAAGLISPFTGEGISFALESGKLVAEAIDRALGEGSRGPLDLAAYRRALGRRYSGYFETGRHGARRYRVIWRVLDDTFEIERPAFRLARQAVLFPEGLGESLTDALFDDVALELGKWRSRARTDLLNVSEVLVDALRRDWPFVARSFIFEGASETVPLRPATVLLLASYAGRGDPAVAAQLGAALELGHLGALSHLSVVDPGRRDQGNETNWGNTFAVLTGDYLLAKAYEMTATVGSEVSRTVADGITRACEARVRESRMTWRLDIPVAQRLVTIRDKLCSLFEIPALIGASIGSTDDAAVEAIRLSAEHVGIAYQLASELSELYRPPTSGVATLISGQLTEGVLTTPILVAAEDRATRDRLVRLLAGPDREAGLREALDEVRGGRAAERTIQLARTHVTRARVAAAPLRNVRDADAFASLVEVAHRKVEAAAVLAGLA